MFRGAYHPHRWLIASASSSPRPLSAGRAYVTTAVPEAVSAHQTSGMPDAVAKVVQDLVAEYEATETIESRVAHDADKIEPLIQAAGYQAQGYDTTAWRESSLAALRTDSGRQLAQAIGSTDSHRWWPAFAASYRELRASTLERARRQHGEGTAPQPPNAET